MDPARSKLSDQGMVLAADPKQQARSPRPRETFTERSSSITGQK
jgi:hypothetical protein